MPAAFRKSMIRSTLLGMGKVRSALVVAGTRPELIKQAPLIKRLRREGQIDVRFCWVSQHRELVAGMFDELGVWPDQSIDLLRLSGTIREQRERISKILSELVCKLRPAITLVQGDTTTAYAAAIASSRNGVPVAHVEAGLRSHNLRSPWPEEMYRRAISRVASMHFAPTHLARDNLLREGVCSRRIWVTGNTGIDSLVEVLRNGSSAGKTIERTLSHHLSSRKPFVLATMHRRESFNNALSAVILALQNVTASGKAAVVFVRHANPLQARVLERVQDATPDLVLTPHLPYRDFLALMTRASLVVTDSGGVTEEATALGVPALIARSGFERPESLTTKRVRLVPPESPRLMQELFEMLDSGMTIERSRLANDTFGDGRAADRISTILGATLRSDAGLRARADQGIPWPSLSIV
jgi:UDP-N-acetylglucosamine 2-epimerase (non-hydrolysing)